MELEIRDNGALVFDGIVVGRAEGKRLTLNLGWTTMAELQVIVYGDPETDRRRIMLSRPEIVTKPDAQLSIDEVADKEKVKLPPKADA